MKHLFIVRHGHYVAYDEDRLTDLGHRKMVKLGDCIHDVLGDDASRYLISSPATRAVNSAGVLMSRLGLREFEEVPYLWSGPDAPDDTYYLDCDLGKLMNIIDERKDKADGLIIVSHLEVVRDLPEHFSGKALNKEYNLPGASKGKAVHFDLTVGKYQLLPPEEK